MGDVTDPMRHHEEAGTFVAPLAGGKFGEGAEKFARFFGTPKFIVIQTVIVIIWFLGNGYFISHMLHGKPFDPYPFILLNLLFSTQAAYAAPLILLSQTRQTDRDKVAEARDKRAEEANARHREEVAAAQQQLLAENTEITRSTQDMQVQQMAILAALHDKEHGNG
jgi:uncharacterized membrane protein